MRPIRFALAVAVAAIVPSLTACSADPSGPLSRSIRSGSASRDEAAPAAPAAPAEPEKPVSDPSFDAADDNGNGAVCVKDTPSGQLLIKDDNANTPSQPCPPSYAFTGKGQAVKINSEWLDEDDNGNKIVCVKSLPSGRFLVKDDNLQTPSQPCPPAYMLASFTKQSGGIPAGPASEADDNGNGVVCIRIVEGTGDAIVKDDNLATPSQPCPPSYSVEGVGKKK